MRDCRLTLAIHHDANAIERPERESDIKSDRAPVAPDHGMTVVGQHGMLILAKPRQQRTFSVIAEPGELVLSRNQRAHPMRPHMKARDRNTTPQPVRD